MIKKNALVLYKNQCALVTETDGEKYAIEFFQKIGSNKKLEKKSVRVREKDFALLHVGPCENLENVLSCEKDFSVAIAEAHELLLSDENSQNAKIDFTSLSELILGNLKCEESFSLYQAILQSAEFVRDEKEAKDGNIFFVPRSVDEVLSFKKKQTEKTNATQVREEFIKRLRQKKIDKESDAKFMNEIEAYALCQTDKCQLMKDAGFAPTIEKAHKLLLDTGIWSVMKNPYPTRFGFSFSSAREGLPKPPEEERLALDAIAYAIDNEYSADPDDAVSFDGKYLWVHIADPASAVAPLSKIDTVARARGTTLYLPEKTSRMLAESSLADYALGLSEVSNALSFRLLLSEEANIEECAIFPTRVKVKRLTYKEADEQKESAELSKLFLIAKKNKEKRKKNGAVSIELSEVHIVVDKENETVSIEKDERFESNDMVQEMMLLAGEACARFAFQNNIPFPYVSQEKPDLSENTLSGFAGQFKLLKSMRKRNVGITPALHAGLGLSFYSQITSPLRRYSDLIAHEQLRAFLAHRTLIDKDAMLMRISEGEAASVAAKRATRASETHWKLVYLQIHIDETYEAFCVDKKDKQIQLYIPSLDVQAFIVPKKEKQLNENFFVKAMNIDIPNQKVDFVEV